MFRWSRIWSCLDSFSLFPPSGFLQDGNYSFHIACPRFETLARNVVATAYLSIEDKRWCHVYIVTADNLTLFTTYGLEGKEKSGTMEDESLP